MKHITFITLSITITLSIILLPSCSTIKESRQETSETTSDTANIPHSKMIDTTNFITYDNILLKASLDINFPNQNHTLSSSIEIAGLDSILIKINAFLGISVGQLYATPNEFIMNNNLENITYIGIPSEKNIMRATFMPLSYNDLVCILKGIPPQKISNYKAQNDFNIFEFSDDNKNELVYMDASFVLSKIVRTEKNGNELFSVEYSNYTTIGDEYTKKNFAKKIVIKFSQQKGRIEINYSAIQFKETPTSPMKITKPKSYKLQKF
jgi:hypothetical protein